jgi:hypothetical protein
MIVAKSRLILLIINMQRLYVDGYAHLFTYRLARFDEDIIQSS